MSNNDQPIPLSDGTHSHSTCKRREGGAARGCLIRKVVSEAAARAGEKQVAFISTLQHSNATHSGAHMLCLKQSADNTAGKLEQQALPLERSMNGPSMWYIISDRHVMTAKTLESRDKQSRGGRLCAA